MTTNKKSSFLRIGLIIGLWLCLWYLTPNLHSYGIGSQITNNGELSIFIETIIALILAIILMYFHQRYNQQLFKWSKIVYFYTVPLVLAVLLPLYYNLSLPVYLYVFWMSISIFLLCKAENGYCFSRTLSANKRTNLASLRLTGWGNKEQ